MRLRKSIYAFIFLILGFNFAHINAQETDSQKQYKILNDYKPIPIEDGKTIIDYVEFIGLDSVEEKYDKSVGKSIPQNELIEHLKSNRQLIEVGDKFYGHKVFRLLTKEFFEKQNHKV